MRILYTGLGLSGSHPAGSAERLRPRRRHDARASTTASSACSWRRARRAMSAPIFKLVVSLGGGPSHQAIIDDRRDGDRSTARASRQAGRRSRWASSRSLFQTGVAKVLTEIVASITAALIGGRRSIDSIPVAGQIARAVAMAAAGIAARGNVDRGRVVAAGLHLRHRRDARPLDQHPSRSRTTTQFPEPPPGTPCTTK